MTIYDYFDYRAYLKDFYNEQKKKSSFFSYRYMAGKVELDPGYLVKVLHGKHHIAQKSIEKFIKLCKLAKKEGLYFETLVYFAKAKTDSEAKLYFEKLLSFKDVAAKKIEPYQYEFYQKWYYSAVRALIGYFPFRDDYATLAEQLNPPITVKEAREAITLLERLSFIKKNDDGIYTLTETLITTGSSWQSLAIRQFQRCTMNLAIESLDRHNPSIRDISTVTMAVASEQLSEIKELVKSFRSSLLKYAEDCPKPNRVYQLNIQIIPLTEEHGQTL
ncbi:MAG: TIGR02147 family protein [Chitinivibrionales bacterium]|nr:TIGR02147 family protein [Chitinivibrionales bacterium]